MAAVGLLQVAGLWLATQAISYREKILSELQKVNGRLTTGEEWRRGHDRHTDEQNDRLSGLEARECRRWEMVARAEDIRGNP